MRTHTGAEAKTVMEYLQGDHRRLDGIMQGCRELAETGRMEEASLRFEMFRKGLLRHIRIEEELLFPAFEGASGLAQGGPTAVMKMEHVEIRRLLDLVRDLFAGPNPDAAEFESLRSALVALLHEHNVKEERILYPMSDRMLSPEDRLDLVRKMQTY